MIPAYINILLILLLSRLLHVSFAYVPTSRPAARCRGRQRRSSICCSAQQSSSSPRRKSKTNGAVSGYADSSVASKGIVSGLTNFVNAVLPADRTIAADASSISLTNVTTTNPASPAELLARIRNDYVVKNYLWTGDIDLSAFDPDCRFTDPTLSFSGTDTFVKNIRNLRPIVEALTRSSKSNNNPAGDDETSNCRSDLLDIALCDGYVQTRWKMVGELTALPWKPRIDVIGCTKFWYEEGEEGWRVYFYDESWEIPAGLALLQIITPAGTIPNSFPKGQRREA